MNEMTDTELLDALQANACGTKRLNVCVRCWWCGLDPLGAGWRIRESTRSEAVPDIRLAIREGLQRRGIGGEPMKSTKEKSDD